MKGWAVVLLMLLMARASAVSEVETAAGFNLALAQTLLGAKNPCGAQERAPSADDPFEAAYVRAVALAPQAGNVSSDLSNISLIWGWAADFPQIASFGLPSGGGCPPGKITLNAPGRARFLDGGLEYTYGSRKSLLGLDGNGPNPAPIYLGQEALFEGDYAALFIPLNITLFGKISVEYGYRKEEYREYCSVVGGMVGCGCELVLDSGRKTYSKEVRHGRIFFVEAGDSYDFWLNPPLGKRLAGKQDAKALLLMRRIPAKVSAFEDGKDIASISPYSYLVSQGECGEMVVEGAFEPAGRNGMEMGAGSAPEFPKQLAGMDAAYLPFYLGFPWDATPGRKNVTIEIEDMFSHRMNFTREFSVREPQEWDMGNAGASENGDAAMLVERGGDHAPPSAYPAQEGKADFLKTGALALSIGIPLALGAAILLRKAAES